MATEMTPENPAASPARKNVPEMSVSELAFSLKKTLEDSYGRVRIRGELTGIKIAASGHLYGDIKDEDANINIVCWKGTMSRLAIKPEDGMEVICTGKVSSYPKSSRYQIIIDSLELAGEGALLKMLEERRKKLAAEGLFDPERKQDLPFLPKTIGVVTSPTGAVIRDIIHRLSDRFPRHVVVWPVLVQGEGANDQITAAINGFDSLPKDGPVPRPDLLIIARGGGSLEDLMPFNEENVVRAAAACSIPLISAVGHETDTTLIDYAADQRAPTPTGAAEIAVPQRLNLMAQIADDEQRLIRAIARQLDDLHNRLDAQAARLGDPARLLETKAQTLDHSAHKLAASFERNLSRKQTQATELGARLSDPARLIEIKTQTLNHAAHKLGNAFTQNLSTKQAHIAERGAMLRHPGNLLAEAKRTLSYRTETLTRIGQTLLEQPQKQLDHTARMLESLSFKSVLERGFVVVRNEQGEPVTAANQTHTGQTVQLQFKDDQNVGAIIGKKSKSSSSPRPTSTKKEDQGQLF